MGTRKPSASVDLGGTATAHPGLLTPELVPVDAVHPHPENPRRGDTTVIGKSLDANRLYRQIIVQRSTGHIIAGNHTYAALRSRDAVEVPVIYLDVDDAAAKRIMADDNHTGDFATNDDRALLDLLASLDGSDLPSSFVGDDALLAILQRRADAEDVFTVGVDHMLDEFKDLSGQDSTEYAREYARKVTIYLRDDATILDFQTKLGLPDDFGKRVNYPLDWQPYDRRLTWKAEREAENSE